MAFRSDLHNRFLWHELTFVPGVVVLAGLAFQVFTMAIFIVCASEFAWRTCARYRLDGPAVFGRAQSIATGHKLILFLLFVAALILATLCIFIRCCFRVAELSRGWTGELMRNQTLFIVFEGTMVLLATFALASTHPAWFFKPMLEGDGSLRLKLFESYRSYQGKRNRTRTRFDLDA